MGWAGAPGAQGEGSDAQPSDAPICGVASSNTVANRCVSLARIETSNNPAGRFRSPPGISGEEGQTPWHADAVLGDAHAATMGLEMPQAAETAAEREDDAGMRRMERCT